MVRSFFACYPISSCGISSICIRLSNSKGFHPLSITLNCQIMTEHEAYIALNMVPNMGAVTVQNGIQRLGSAAALFTAGVNRLACIPGITFLRAEKFAQAFAQVDWKSEIARAEQQNVKLVTLADDTYPELLRTIPSPPLALYIAGDSSVLQTASLAMVGTRAPTAYGREAAKRFAYRLAQAGVTIVSGLARGIDTESHAATLLAKGRTVAVVGGALDKLYPPENRELARSIVKSGGAIISEYPFGRPADRQTFPMRNRIISGLSSAVLVVEAGSTSGTLITCSHALEQGRTVMAIPGRIDTVAAQGCHKIIKEGARLVETPEEVLEELQSIPGIPHFVAASSSNSQTASETTPSSPPLANLDEVESQILKALGSEELTADELVNATGILPHLLGSRLMSLEIKAQIERIGATTFRRKHP